MKAPSGTNPGPRLPVQLGLVLTMVFWGSAFVTSKMIVFEVPPDVGAVLRFGLGAVLMMGVLFRRSARPVPPREVWGRIAAVGIVGVTAFNTCFFHGLALAPASDAAMIIPAISPVFTAAAGILFLGEPARFHRVAGLAISLVGATLFFWGVIAHTSGQATRLFGDLFLLGAAASWACCGWRGSGRSARGRRPRSCFSLPSPPSSLPRCCWARGPRSSRAREARSCCSASGGSTGGKGEERFSRRGMRSV